MIVELSVENLAIIERCDLAPGPGFTALTGETGAGKSLLVDALELAFGSRAETGIVRSGATRTLVSVTVDLTSRPELAARCAELGAQPQEGLLYLQREVFAEGRSQCRIGGRMAPLGTLREVGRLLVDLHGQHDHQSLLDPKTHLGFLDSWIGAEAQRLGERVLEALERWRSLDAKLQQLRGGRREREQRIDLLRFQISDIEATAPKAGELAELESRLKRLEHAEQLARAVAEVRQALIEGETAGRDLLSGSARSLAEAERLDPGLSRIREPLDQAVVLVDDALGELSAYQETLESSPGLLEDTAARIDALKRLLRKYGDDEAGLLEFLEKAKVELELLSEGEEGETALAESAASARSELEAASGELSTLRREQAVPFAKLIEGQLQDLAMEKAQFEVAFQPKEIDETGGDQAEFLFSANLGEPMRPLSRIASGGEISRAMLAIKTALSGRAGVPTMIFDEVDSGLGGRAAATVARKLEELARNDQVIVITHLPQIAARATAHYRIEKLEDAGRVSVRARLLEESERVSEMARMLSGEDVGDSALAHARELLTRQ